MEVVRSMAEAPSALRANVRRNHERLMESARAAFAEQGTEVSLREVARRAGVGIGTLYRHFPTRETLLEALLRDRFEDLRDEASRLQRTLPPFEALNTWLRSFARGSAQVRGLPESVLVSLQDEGSGLHSACETMRSAGAALLSAAQRSGVVRADVTATELYTLATGIAWAATHVPTDPDLRDRLLTMALRSIAATSEPEG
jgi:AcrR family transcriptional regulator